MLGLVFIILIMISPFLLKTFTVLQHGIFLFCVVKGNWRKVSFQTNTDHASAIISCPVIHQYTAVNS